MIHVTRIDSNIHVTIGPHVIQVSHHTALALSAFLLDLPEVRVRASRTPLTIDGWSFSAFSELQRERDARRGRVLVSTAGKRWHLLWTELDTLGTDLLAATKAS